MFEVLSVDLKETNDRQKVFAEGVNMPFSNSADEMEFEVTSDQRSGKPIACQLSRLSPGTVSFEVINS